MDIETKFAVGIKASHILMATDLTKLVSSQTLAHVDGVSPSVFRCTSTPMETGPIDTCVET